ncbi:MAG TPA: hypothetical protein VE954_31025 [Oligoflexus sp.]|uniref:hypothetical protein n=1 Tax=Oligoflexus sp. TaxID=1971216 RepID=UPI002D2751ED|nr:hypothetical protein [Oligoflexus sp.]HYX37558.1 hypothetical protein [Oligoflexus sp.]
MTLNGLLPYLTFWVLWFALTNGLEFLLLRRRLVPLASPYMTIANQVANLLHAAVVMLLGFYIVFAEFNLQNPLTFWQRELAEFSSAFFLVDTMALLVFRHKKWDIFLHHILCLISFQVFFHDNASGWIMAATVALAEMGPCIYIENIAKRWAVQSKRFYQWNDRLYLASFLFTRLGCLSVIFFIALFWAPASFGVLLVGMGLWAIGFYWSYLLLQRYRRRYRSAS